MTPSIALAFPGQGAQHVGMGADVAAAHPAAKRVFDLAGEVLGLDLLSVCRDGPAEELVRTDLQQPAILAVGAAVTEALRASGAHRDEELACAFGLSLGEFTALWAAGSLDLADALRLVRERGLGMQEASEAVPSGMLALRAEVSAAEALCAAARAATHGTLVVANLNAPGQVVLSGDLASIEAAERLGPAHGIRRPTRLPVAGAFHSPLMRPGAERLARALEDVVVRAPRIPVVSNVTAAATSDPATIRRNLIDQVTSPVRFVECVETAVRAGVRRFVEPAPGRVLGGLIRRIAPDVVIVGAADAEGVAAAGAIA